MSKLKSTLSWLAYERCAAAFISEQYDDLEITVQHNVKLIGQSGITRQIDVLIDSRWPDGEDRRIVVDAKKRSRKVDIKEIEAFEGMMRDCNAGRGVIVCSSGCTEGALRRAQDAITITVLDSEDLPEYKWVYEPCFGRCNEGSPSRRGMVLWAAYMGIAPSENVPILILQTGKCDGCHSFHVWCWGCGLKFPVSDNSVQICDCGYRWVAYLSQSKSEFFLGYLVDQENVLILDRRPTI